MIMQERIDSHNVAIKEKYVSFIYVGGACELWFPYKMSVFSLKRKMCLTDILF